MFSRWTETARQTVFWARYEAGRVGAERIDTEDLLLGLVRVAPELLRSVGAESTLEGIREEANRWRPKLEAVPESQDMPVSDDVGQVFALTDVIAPTDWCRYFRTEHLLLALVELEGSHAATLLAEAGADLEAIRRSAAHTDCNEQQRNVNTSSMPLLE